MSMFSHRLKQLNLLQILRPDVYFNKKLSDDEFYEISRNYYQKLIDDININESKINNKYPYAKANSIVTEILCANGNCPIF